MSVPAGVWTLRVFEKIDGCLRKQFAIANDRESWFNGPQERSALVLNRRRIALRKVRRERADVNWSEMASRFSALDLGDPQDRSKQRQDFIDPVSASSITSELDPCDRPRRADCEVSKAGVRRSCATSLET